MPKEIRNRRSGRGKRQPETEEWKLELYVADHSPNCARAITNLTALRDKNLPVGCSIEVIDVLKHPQICSSEQIVAIPTLVKRSPAPATRLVGGLSNMQRVRARLGLAA